MKTTVVVACFSNNKGGMELNAMGVARLLAQDHSVTLVCRRGSYIETCEKSLVADGIGFEVVDFTGNFSLRCIRDVRQIIKSLKIKNLIFFGASELKSLALACLGLKVRILNFHGTTKSHSKKDPLHALIYRSVKFHIPVSEHIKRNVIQIIPGATEQNTKVVYLPCDWTFTGEKTLSSPAQLIHVGRIAEGKGHEDCLKVLAHLAQKKRPATLSFLGGVEDEALSQRLHTSVQNNPELKERVYFVGFTNQVFQKLCEAQYLLFPSKGEGLPNTLIEAFLAKTLPITYDNTVFPEFLKMGFDFLQAKDGDIEHLSRCVEETLSWTAEEYAKKVNQNYKLAQKYFSGANVLKQYNNLLA